MKGSKIKIFSVILIVLISVWWYAMTPPAYLQTEAPIIFDERAIKAAKKVNFSNEFSNELELISSELPGHDDVIFLDHGNIALVSAMDGKIWTYNFSEQKAEVFIDPPLMASGLHESLTSEEEIFFCSSYLWGDTYPKAERVGLYKLHLPTREITPIVVDVPDTAISSPKIWALNDPSAPSLMQGSGDKSRPLAFCNDLEITNDGKRIYFTEPFSYSGASMGGGAVHELLAYRGNGRIWHHDLNTGETRLVVEGFHFLDGILFDFHPEGEIEESIVSSLTPGFRIMRFYVNGARAGQFQVIQDGLPGMCDGMDRDLNGNIWCGMFTDRSSLLTWLHENPWMKNILLRLPLNSMSQPKRTGVMVFSADASTFLYYAKYEGDKASQIASAIPGPDGYVYMTPFSRKHRGLVRLPNPLK